MQVKGLECATFSAYHPAIDSFGYLGLSMDVFPSGEGRFNETGITMIGYVLNNLSFNPPSLFGPYFLIAYTYGYYTGNSEFDTELKNNSDDFCSLHCDACSILS
jgi:hypothetical protein